MSKIDNDDAQRIADGGHAALVSLLRPHFERQAAARADTLDLPYHRLDELIEAAAQRADGVLWRRALAEVAMIELGVDLPHAVLHPAVDRAHGLVGAPPWTPPADEPADAAEIDERDEAPRVRRIPRRRPGASADTVKRVERRPEREPEPEPEPQPAPEPQPHADAELEPTERPSAGWETEAPAHETGAESTETAEQPAMEVSHDRQALRLAAVHLGGIETVRQGDRDIELRLSPAGLDVLRRSSGTAIGRLEWAEIETIDLPRARRGLRPGRGKVQELHVATDRGQASFELPGLTEEQVKEHLEPMLARARGVVVEGL